MAFIESTGVPMPIPSPDDLSDPDFQLPRWVNVSNKVGENVRGVKSVDTLWVQFVIKNIFDGPGMSKLTIPLKVDGIYGDKTQKWIQHFQRDQKAQGLAQGDTVFLPVHPDGAVSRVPAGDFFEQRKFTAYRLNKVLAIINPLLAVMLTNAARSNATLEVFIRVAMQQAA